MLQFRDANPYEFSVICTEFPINYDITTRRQKNHWFFIKYIIYAFCCFIWNVNAQSAFPFTGVFLYFPLLTSMFRFARVRSNLNPSSLVIGCPLFFHFCFLDFSPRSLLSVCHVSVWPLRLLSMILHRSTMPSVLDLCFQQSTIGNTSVWRIYL